LHQCHSPPALCQLQWLSAVKEWKLHGNVKMKELKEKWWW
jgi:hypothetical protein